MVTKLDMSKAYDRLKWSFIEAMLRKMGFNERWIRLVMQCIILVSFSIVLNGKLSGHFSPKRGIRQGVLLSPYIFILVTEALSNMLKEAEEKSQISGVKVCRRSPAVSHLFLADDCQLFSKANRKEIEAVAGILSTYCHATGQRINLDKSLILFSPNSNSVVRQKCKAALGILSEAFSEHYLGLPTRIG